MTKWIPMLSGLLVAQLVLAVVVKMSGEDYGAFQPRENLLAFDGTKVEVLRIEDGESHLELRKRDGRWWLPGDGDLPADSGAVDRLVNKVASLEKGWPVATSTGALKRFAVDDGQFERKLTLSGADDEEATLYVGTSPGFRKVHVRPAGEDVVYAAIFNAWEASVDADDWIDKDLLKLSPDDLTRVEMPGLTLQREDDTWRVAGLSDQESTDSGAAASLVEELAGLRIQGVLGPEAKQDPDKDKPALEIGVTRKDGTQLHYRFGKPEEGAYFVLDRSDLKHHFEVADFVVKPLQEAKREALVKARTEALDE